MLYYIHNVYVVKHFINLNHLVIIFRLFKFFTKHNFVLLYCYIFKHRFLIFFDI